MDDYKFGANILENLTTGMYRDSRTIYREYIQNSCDSIDNAIKAGIITEDDAEIRITIQPIIRKITIEDNGTGIPAEKFKEVLGNIADSDKKIGDARGFRGIGRLCGLAYCEEVLFISKYKDENVESMLRCKSKDMRRLLNENAHGSKYSAAEVLRQINEFSQRQPQNNSQHFFRVELININEENKALLNVEDIKKYLSFVAPVAYDPKFRFKTDIKKYARKIKFNIDEYKIIVNDGNGNIEQLFKDYRVKFKTKMNEDEISAVEFQDFQDGSGNRIAWMWWGKSNFKGVIAKDIPMRGIRLRAGNIQIGDEYVFKNFFKEQRGTTYFIGEVFTISSELIPNSQRDYLNENPTRVSFERLLKMYFSEELNDIYRNASKMRSDFKKIAEFRQEQKNFEEAKASGSFVDAEEVSKKQKELEEKRKQVDKSVARLEKLSKNTNPTVQEISQNVESEILQIDIPEPTKSVKYVKDRFEKLSDHDKEIINRTLKAIKTKLDEQLYSKVLDAVEKEFK